MIISQTVSPDLYKQVAQEFVRKEVNYPGHKNESLAALYKVLSGNYDDCVDELVSSHARAGLQLVSKESSSGPTNDAVDGLDKWRETLTLVLSNRSNDDVLGLNALGKLLSSYGRAEAAHICFIFSRQLSVFGGFDDNLAQFVLVGSDHHKQSQQFAKELEALQLSEVYEYGLSLAGGIAATAGAPHLAAHKLQHAVILAEHGFRDKALQYCDALSSAIISQTRRSQYHHPILEASVEDLLARLKQAPSPPWARCLTACGIDLTSLFQEMKMAAANPDQMVITDHLLASIRHQPFLDRLRPLISMSMALLRGIHLWQQRLQQGPPHLGMHRRPRRHLTPPWV
jgi:hypothetical protein